MAVFYSTLLTKAETNAIYASIIASNVAAFFTPIGALAGLRWMNLLKKQDIIKGTIWLLSDTVLRSVSRLCFQGYLCLRYFLSNPIKHQKTLWFIDFEPEKG